MTDHTRKRREDFLVFGAPHIEEEEIQEVYQSLRNRWIGTGPKVQTFEDEFRHYKGTPEAVAVSSCTAALHLSLIAAGIGHGDEVIAPALTFCATINAIIHAGGTPVLADVDPLTFNLDTNAVAEAVTEKTKAIIPVHFAGRMCDMGSLAELAKQRGLKIIEDCAHAIESEVNGVRSGTVGDFGCFSFYATKNVTTAEGGMIITRSAAAADRIRRLALHGLSADAWARYSDKGFKHYLVDDLGFKYNMTDLHASLGIHQLRRVERNWERRQQIWNRYNRELADLPVTLPAPVASGSKHAYHLYTILIEEGRTGLTRDEVISRLWDWRIGTGVHYRSIPEHPYYARTFGWRPQHYPVSHRIGLTTISLPLSAAMNETDVSDVISALREVLQ